MEDRERLDICREAIYGENYNDYIFGYYGQEVERKYEANEVCSQFVNRSLSILYIPAGSDPMTNNNQYEYQTVPKLYGLMDTSAAEAVGVLRVRRQPYVDLFGQGTLIGIIDTGERVN